MGEHFGHYRLDELIGRGGMGDVYRAFDTVKKRTVALKLLPAHLAQDGDFQARFRREAELAARLTEPHIIPIHDYGELAGQLFIDMRLISGTDLAGLIRRVGPLPPARAVAIVAQIASALAAAHAERLVHRDVKPSNVLISTTDRGEDFVHLVDFGVAHSEAATALTATGATIGTVDYMAPEQFEGRRIDHRVDVYALGCVLHEALTASKPFPGGGLPVKMQAHLNTPPPRPSQLRPGVSPGLDRVVATAMAKRPDQRFASTTDLAIAAQHSLRDAPPVGERPATRPYTGVQPATTPGFDRRDQVTEDAPPSTTPGFPGAAYRSGAPAPDLHAPAPGPFRPATPPPGAYGPPPGQWSPAGSAPVGPLPGGSTPAGAPRPGRRRRLLLLVGLPLAALVVIVAVLLANGPTGQLTGTGATGTPGATSTPGPGTTGAAGSTRLDLSGYATGTLTSPSVECQRLGGESWSWTVQGAIGDSPVEISFTTNNWRGAAVYNTTGITDPLGGFLTVKAGTVSFISNGNDTGKLTVADGERSGSIDTVLDDATAGDQQIRISGSWQCA